MYLLRIIYQQKRQKKVKDRYILTLIITLICYHYAKQKGILKNGKT